jgi:hypothetical protein
MQKTKYSKFTWGRRRAWRTMPTAPSPPARHGDPIAVSSSATPPMGITAAAAATAAAAIAIATVRRRAAGDSNGLRLEAVPRRRDPCAHTHRRHSLGVTERREWASKARRGVGAAGVACTSAHHLSDGWRSSSTAASASNVKRSAQREASGGVHARSPARRCAIRDVRDAASVAATTRASTPKHARDTIGCMAAAAKCRRAQRDAHQKLNIFPW